MFRRYRFILSLFLLAAGSWAHAGTKEEIIRLQSDILDTQKRIHELQKSSDANARDIKTLLEQVNEQLAKTNSTLAAIKDGLPGQQADLKLAVDSLLKETRVLSEKLEDTNSRISTLSQQVSASKIQIEEAGKKGANPVASPSTVFNTALNDYNRGAYDLALQGFQNYLSNYKGTELAADAQYYVGECLYNLNRFDEAVVAFNQVINSYPNSSRLLAAYLKKGLALMELNRRPDAIEQFKLLVLRYPDTQEANIAKQKLELLGAKPERSAPSRSRSSVRRSR